MICSKCGKEIEKGNKFCPSCGAKAEEKKKEEVKAEKVETKEVKKEAPKKNGLAIAGMIIGIVSLCLSWILTVIILILPIVGLILSIVSKGKKGLKITGIITNALSIVLCIVLVFVYATTFGSIMGGLFGEIGTAVKGTYPYGTWTCVPFSSMNTSKYDYENIKANNSASSLTVLELNTDRTYTYGPYVDSNKNYYKGEFTYEIETEKNSQENNISNGYSFVLVKGDVSAYMVDGVSKDISNKSLNLEMELFKQYNYDKALIMFTNSYNMYMCER